MKFSQTNVGIKQGIGWRLAWVLAVLTGWLIGFTIPSVQPTSPVPTPTATPITLTVTESAKIEYYRAVYDLCTYYGRKSKIDRQKMEIACFELVRKTMEKDWFETGSPGWKWPIPEKRIGETQ